MVSTKASGTAPRRLPTGGSVRADRAMAILLRRSIGLLTLLTVIPIVALASDGSAPARGLAPLSPVGSSGVPSFLPDWTSLPFDPYPLSPATSVQPVLTGLDVTEGPAAFVADPFLFHEGETWYMFFEAWIFQGTIALATSSDGLNWTYDRIVIGEGYPLSYPYVISWNGEHYIVLSVPTRNSIYLYRATDFPHQWMKAGTMISGRNFADASLFRYNDRWWIFVATSGSQDCRLYYSNSLLSGWTEHPLSPIVDGDPGKARPAGRCLVYDSGRILRLAQKSDVSYGQGVRAFEVTMLTPQAYQEHEIPESPILMASGSGWNAEGMHTCDPWWDGQRWTAAVDGVAEGGEWSIGIYRTPLLASAEDGTGITGADRFAFEQPRPNPSRGATEIRFRLAGDPPGGGPIGFAILDASGREVRRLASPSSSSGNGIVRWDGLNDRGERLPAGIYFCSGRAGAARAAVRLLLIR
jgi:hypothetical protein